ARSCVDRSRRLRTRRPPPRPAPAAGGLRPALQRGLFPHPHAARVHSDLHAGLPRRHDGSRDPGTPLRGGMSMTLRPRIGVSANFMHADPERPLYRGKTLQYVESGMMNASWAGGGIPVVVPSLSDPAG